MLEGRSVVLHNEEVTLLFFEQVKVMFVPEIGSLFDSDDDFETNDDASSSLPLPARKRAPAIVLPAKRSLDALHQTKYHFPAFQWMIDQKKIVSKNVLRSICDSMHRRYGGVPQKFQNLTVDSHEDSDKVLTPRHFGCVTVIVRDAETQQQCISFISEGSAFSFDTESPQPKHSHEPISLVQIGTTMKVFLIHLAVAGNNDSFFGSLREALKGKTLVHFDGDDPKQLCSVLKCHHSICSFKNIQQSMRTKGQLPGLKKCIETLMHHRYELSKVWTLSGWDLFPLNQDQVNYATLDVVCTHALYLSSLPQPEHVFQYNDSNRCHSFLLPNSQRSLIRHGFCDTSDFLGHMESGELSQGFRIDQNSVVPAGFHAGSNCTTDTNPLDCFIRLLEEKRFCCSMCSLSQTWVRWSPRFQYSASQDHTSIGYTRDITVKTPKFSHRQVNFEHHHTPKVQDAIICVSMLGALFNLKFNMGQNMETVCYSVHQDCQNGYISKTFAHLTTP